MATAGLHGLFSCLLGPLQQYLSSLGLDVINNLLTVALCKTRYPVFYSIFLTQKVVDLASEFQKLITALG